MCGAGEYGGGNMSCAGDAVRDEARGIPAWPSGAAKCGSGLVRLDTRHGPKATPKAAMKKAGPARSLAPALPHGLRVKPD